MEKDRIPLEVERSEVIIIGTGFAGLGLGIQLKRRGIESFVMLERAGAVGGTWRDNTYPGAACDIQSHLYSYSFRPNPEWSRVYAPQQEILDYLQDAAADECVLPHARFESEVTSAEWDDGAREWTVTTTRGIHIAPVLVSAAGHLSDPKLPDIPGIESFAGELFHSARWDHSAAFDGRRVGVVGTGASAIQIIPELQRDSRSLTVFQRSAPYIIPRVNPKYSEAERATFRRVPEVAQALRDELFWANEARFPQRRMIESFLNKIQGTALAHLRAQISNPALLERLTPDYTIGCKRILISNDYYPALGQANVDLVTAPIIAVVPGGVVLSDGTRVELDTLVLATGFEASDLPISHRVRGRNGQLLANRWETGEQAFACSTVHGFPNLFIMNGPNSGLGAGSIIYVIERQIDYILGGLQYLSDNSASVAAIEPTEVAEEAYAAMIEERSAGTVWMDGGCASWYVDPRNGRLTTIWPDFMTRFGRENGHFSIEGYETIAPRELAVVGSN